MYEHQTNSCYVVCALYLLVECCSYWAVVEQLQKAFHLRVVVLVLEIVKHSIHYGDREIQNKH